MALEREITVRQVEDESGQGFFQITIEEGGVERPNRVPALSIKGGYGGRYGASRAYIQQQFETGTPVVAYRAGGWGVCEVAVDPNVVDISHARETFRDLANPREWHWRDRDLKQSRGTYFVGPAGNSALELTGINKQTDAPIKITVGFVR